MAGSRFALARRKSARAALAAATVLAACGLTSVAWPGSVSADVPVSSVGWWTQNPAPPTVPEGGVSVADSPSGWISIAAVKLDIGGGASSAKLSIAEDASNSQGGPAASLEACSTTNDWTSAKGDPMTKAPPADCRNPVALARDANGVWTGDISPLLSSGTGSSGEASVMIVPAPAAAQTDLTGGVPFQLSFQPPSVAGTVESTDDSSSSSSSSSSDTATSPSYGSTSPDTSGSTSSSGGTSSFNPSSSFTTPSVDSTSAGAVAAPPTTAAPPASGSSQQALSSQASTGSGQFKANIHDTGASSNHRATRGAAIGVFVLALLIGALGAAASWAKAQGMFDLSGLRERFSR